MMDYRPEAKEAKRDCLEASMAKTTVRPNACARRVGYAAAMEVYLRPPGPVPDNTIWCLPEALQMPFRPTQRRESSCKEGENHATTFVALRHGAGNWH